MCPVNRAARSSLTPWLAGPRWTFRSSIKARGQTVLTVPVLPSRPDIFSGLTRTSLPVSVLFDLGNNEYPVQAKRAEVLYAGGVPGSTTGLLQLNVRVPSNAVTTGAPVPFALFIGSHWTMLQVTIPLR